MLKYIFLALIASITCHNSIFGQVVWPGDVNNNGVVNEVDVLYWGWANGKTGPARSLITTNWEAQNANQIWSQRFPNGINYAYADCDGNGVVEEDDLKEAIEENFGLRHGDLLPDGFQNGSGEDAIKLSLESNETIVAEGATVQISLKLQNKLPSVRQFYGMALKLSYNASILQDDEEIDFDLQENSWLYAADDNVEQVLMENETSGQSGLAITRTNQQSVPIENGEIGKFTVVIEDIILYAVDTFVLTVDSVLLFDDQFVAVAVAPDTIKIVVAKDPKVVSVESKNKPYTINIFPNPSYGEVFLETQERITDVRLYNQYGRTFPLVVEPLQKGVYRVKMPKLTPGIYWIGARTNDKMAYFKIIHHEDN